MHDFGVNMRFFLRACILAGSLSGAANAMVLVNNVLAKAIDANKRDIKKLQ
jgi:hypothetical protein